MKRIVSDGEKYGRLTVVSFSHVKKNHSYYECLCDCGKTKIVMGSLLKHGGSLSCGCLASDVNSVIHRKHTMEGTPLYRMWRNMKTRCLNPKSTSYKYYGGKGVSICSEWMEFIPFMKWAFENGYKTGMSIDRIDGDADYTPANCRFLTKEENRVRAFLKGVVCIETGVFYRSMKDIRLDGKPIQNITRACKNHQLTASGFHWRYATKEEVANYERNSST